MAERKQKADPTQVARFIVEEVTGESLTADANSGREEMETRKPRQSLSRPARPFAFRRPVLAMGPAAPRSPQATATADATRRWS